jgi:dTDP-4-dehydrorhamnose 3,5-epimerase
MAIQRELAQNAPVVFSTDGLKKDHQSVTPDGAPLIEPIEGVVVRPLITQEDQRGEVVEIYRPAWGIHPEPLVYAYQVMLRPGVVKGWTIHQHQDDRIFNGHGVLRWALYDYRDASPTYGKLNVFTFSERNRALLIIPAGVFHAVQNIGQQDAYFVNLPTQPYNHANPDKHRLPVKNDIIPFAFDDGPGW